MTETAWSMSRVGLMTVVLLLPLEGELWRTCESPSVPIVVKNPASRSPQMSTIQSSWVLVGRRYAVM